MMVKSVFQFTVSIIKHFKYKKKQFYARSKMPYVSYMLPGEIWASSCSISTIKLDSSLLVQQFDVTFFKDNPLDGQNHSS